MPLLRLHLVVALACAALLAGCADPGAAASRGPSVVPMSSETGRAPADVPAAFTVLAPPTIDAARRRTLSSTPSCTGAGSGSFVGIANGSNVAAGTDTVVAGGFHDLACDDYSAVLGGDYNSVDSSNNSAVYGFIGSGFSNQIMAGQYGAITGGLANTIDASSGEGATIGGGLYNQISGQLDAIAGGYYNSISSDDQFVGGGAYNAGSALYTAIAGGEHNSASGIGAYIGGGGYNAASGEGAIVDGGYEQTASGAFATIPGGYANTAAGTYSFAAGARASAAQAGTFVWSDGSNGANVLGSTRAYQFLARASGGVTFWTNSGATVGATLAPGSGTWASASDRNLKTDVAPLDDSAVLAKVAALPISRWSYRSERGVRHVGPMAQDFYAAFAVGEDDKHITAVDEDGIALAAIKALRSENVRLRAQQQTSARREHGLQSDVATLRAEMNALRSQVAALRAEPSAKKKT